MKTIVTHGIEIRESPAGEDIGLNERHGRPGLRYGPAIVGSRVEAQVPSVPLVALACVSPDEAIVPRGGRLRLSC